MFSFFLANRTLQLTVLDGVDYARLFVEPSALEQTYAIFANVLEIDDNGRVNDARASLRAAQYIRSYVDQSYVVEPPFEDWELELHL